VVIRALFSRAAIGGAGFETVNYSLPIAAMVQSYSIWGVADAGQQ